MPRTGRPRVTIVDDEPETLGILPDELRPSVNVTVVSPADVTEDVLERTDLLLVDLRLEDWPERDNTQWIAQRPRDGLALASVLRSNCDFQERGSPVAFAVYSAHLRDLCGRHRFEKREHTIARANNLEWVFPKRGSTCGVELPAQIRSLADAVRRLPTEWPTDDSAKTCSLVNGVLGLKESLNWYQTAWEDIRSCRPPIHELSHWSHGLAVLRWLLHRILPYPGFLYDELSLACRMRVSVDSLQAELATASRLAKLIKKCEYKGILTGFVGTRWWKCAIDDLLWQETKGNSLDAAQVTKALQMSAETDWRPLGIEQPVVCIDSTYAPYDIHPIDNALRVQPDNWPSFADQAWTTIERAHREPTLAAIVESRDRRRMKDDGGT